MLANQINDYIIYSKQHRYSKRTIEAREYALGQFLAFLHLKEIECWQKCTEKEVRDYIIYRSKQVPENALKSLTPASLQTQLATVRLFFDYLVSEKIISYNPATFVELPKKRQRLPNVLEVELIGKILNKIPSDDYEVRDSAICELFYSCGLRLSELANLNWSNIDKGISELRVISGKGDKDRILPIGHVALSALERWRTTYEEWINNKLIESDALFINKRGGRLSSRQISNRVKRYALEAGVNINLHPHLLRHSMATHLLESSQDIRMVQEMLGHADISTTQIYTHLDFGHLSKIFDQAHPRAKKKPEES